MYTVAIRNNETREIRMCVQDLDWNDDVFWWTEGNMSCDCNRALTFARAGNEKCVDDSCGETRFTALYAELEGGKRIELNDVEDLP